MTDHRLFAATYDLITCFSEVRVLRPLRAALLADARGQVLEIGAGTGANFPYYRHAATLVAVEPDPFMARRARQRAQRLGLAVEFYQAPAEALPFPDASFDSVVSTLLLCSVGNPARALSEMRRVLKPGGALRFIEHVRADGWAGRVQDRITPFWRRCAAGCHPNRRTAAAIDAAGLKMTRLKRRRLPLFPLIVGVAVRQLPESDAVAAVADHQKHPHESLNRDAVG